MTTQVYVHYRQPNHITEKDTYPLPWVEDNLNALQGGTWLSTLNQILGYQQFKIDLE